MTLVQLLQIIDTDENVKVEYTMHHSFYCDDMRQDYVVSGQVPVKYAMCTVKKLRLDCGDVVIEIDYEEEGCC